MQNRFALLTGMVLALLFTATLPAFAQDCATPDGYEPEVEYFTADNVYKFCNGTEWIEMIGGGDWEPDAFSFTDQTGVALSTLISSNIVQITGMDDGTSISISGDGTPAYRICADATCSTDPAFTSSAGTINNNDYLQLRLTSNASATTMNSATVTVGSVSDQWDVTTGTGTKTVVIKAWGAGGGGDEAGQGGSGGFTTATYEMASGTTLYIWAGTGGAASGRIGASGAGGSPGGGSTGGGGGGGAGGYSGVFSANTLSQANALVIAGGGGGESNHGGSGPGGAGGGTNGQNAGGTLGAYGGTQSAGGGYQGNPGSSGSALQGGTGVGTSAGGGGWFGGGQGGDNGSTHAAGGGGSGYIRTSSLPSGTTYTSGNTYTGSYATPASQATSDPDYPGSSIAYGGGNPGYGGYIVVIINGTKYTYSAGTAGASRTIP